MSTPPTPQAAIYARVSTEDQGKGFSVPTQLEACRKLAEQDGYTVPETHVFVDEGISGTTLDRPGLRTLRLLVTTRAIQAVIVYDPDRLSRHLGQQLLLAEEFEQAGVRLLIVSHPLEQGPEGWLFFQLRGALAEYERAKLLERTRRGTVGRIQAGHPPGGRVPLGYRYLSAPHGGRYEIEAEEAALVRRIYALCLEGLSLRAIARQLTAEGVPTPLERRAVKRDWRRSPPGTWAPTTVRDILTAETYTGHAAWGKRQNLPAKRRGRRPADQWIRLPVPPIIDGPTFEAAQVALRQHKALARRHRKYAHLFVGARLRCGRCGRGMTGTYRRPYRYYFCNSRHQVMDPAARCAGSIRADRIEPQVWAAVVRVLDDPQLIAAEVARQQATLDEERAAIERELATVAAALARREEEERRLVAAYTAGAFTPEQLKAYLAPLAAQRARGEAQRQAVEARLAGLARGRVPVATLVDYCVRVRQRLTTFSVEEQRRTLQALDIRVTWTPGQPLAITGRIPLGAIVHGTPWRSS
jgi:site-specific DNA recombinase